MSFVCSHHFRLFRLVVSISRARCWLIAWLINWLSSVGRQRSTLTQRKLESGGLMFLFLRNSYSYFYSTLYRLYTHFPGFTASLTQNRHSSVIVYPCFSHLSSEWSERDTRTIRNNFIHNAIPRCPWHCRCDGKTEVDHGSVSKRWNKEVMTSHIFWRHSISMGHYMYILVITHTIRGHQCLTSTLIRKSNRRGLKRGFLIGSTQRRAGLLSTFGTHGKGHDGPLDCSHLQHVCAEKRRTMRYDNRWKD